MHQSLTVAGALLAAAALARQAGAQSPRATDQSSGVTVLLQSVSAVSPEVVWVGGDRGTVLVTTDGGNHWTPRSVSGAERLQFRGIHALDARQAWAMSSGNGSDSRIYHTVDGGLNWTLQFTNTDSAAFYDCIAFFDARHGVAYSDASGPQSNILRTEDGGAHWALLPPGAAPAALPKEGAFASSNSCVVTIDDRVGWIAASEPGARVFRSDDAGATWRVVSSESPLVHGATAGITALSFRDARHGIATAAVIDNAMMRDTTPNAVAVTGDGGATWTLAHRPAPPGALSGAALVPAAGDAVAGIASYGGVFVTADLGNTWSPLGAGRYWAVRAAGRRAWAVGAGGRITRVDF